MNFINRGLLSIRRKLGKNITLLILVFVLGNIMIGAIAIKQAVKNTEVNLRNKIGAIATLEPDYNVISNIDSTESIEYITSKQIDEIGSLPYVKYYDYTSTTGLQSSTLKRYEDPNIEMGIYTDSAYYYTLVGVQNKEMFDIKQNKIKLVSGRTFNEDETTTLKNVIMMSKTLAELNNLNVGSKVTLSNIIYDYRDMDIYSEKMLPTEQKIYAKKDIEFEIVGIFDPIKEVKKGNNIGIDVDYQNVENQNKIYTTNKVVSAVNEYTYAKYKELDPENYGSNNQEYLTPLFVLKDPLELEEFKKTVEKIIPESYKIVDNSSSLNTITVPMENMDWIASLVLYVSIFSTIVIIGLLITLFIRDRKHEMGIYLSLGEKRKNVVLQILTEVIIVSFIGMTLALFSGSLIASSLSKTMLKNQVAADEKEKSKSDSMIYEESTTLDWLGYGSSVSSEEMIASYKVSISPVLILIFYSVGLGTVFVSTITPTIYIIRLNPKKIMM